ncbi:MAG: HAMP domain-containing histidine kinase [Desulfotomaculum sp.]|nr:HAMP domain-containing histidine kinase [Desulfotomaculum sp.]
MDTKSKSYSHSLVTKIALFVIVIFCFTAVLTTFLNVLAFNDHHISFDIVNDANFYESNQFRNDARQIINSLKNLMFEFKSKDFILSGATVSEAEIKSAKKNLFTQFRRHSIHYDAQISHAENLKIFMVIYADRIAQIKEVLIQEDIKRYNHALTTLNEFEGVLYYATDGIHSVTNAPNISREYFKSLPAYALFSKSTMDMYPKELQENFSGHKRSFLHKATKDVVIYLGFENAFLEPKINEWQENKIPVTNNLYQLFAFLLGAILSLILLIIIIGRNSFKDKNVSLNILDKLYVDINLVLCLGLILLWFIAMGRVFDIHCFNLLMVASISSLIAIMGLLLVLSLVKHFKNSTFIRHGLIFKTLYGLFRLLRDLLNNSNAAVIALLMMVGYPLLFALVMVMLVFINLPELAIVLYPLIVITGSWLAFQTAKDFNTIKEVTGKIKTGDFNQKIELSGNSILTKLAGDINSIADGLNKALDNELRSERLKTELITNVSHDIRTPLTAIITYVDLFKKEDNISKKEEYLAIIDRKAHKLKTLTDDLFEASKASSGNLPVNYKKIDLVFLITQGLGELNTEIEKSKLDFKFTRPQEKIYIKVRVRKVIINTLYSAFNFISYNI